MRFHLRALLILLVLGPPVATILGCAQRQEEIAPITLKQRALPPEVKAVLDDAQQLELFSIGVVRDGATAFTGDTFQTCTLLGKAEIDDEKEREELLNALYEGIQNSDGSMALCFDPGFGLRATTGNDTVELLLCFECLQIEISFRGQKQMVYTTPSPLSTFKKALHRAGVPSP